MIADTLVFVCAAFGIVAGSCFDFRQAQEPSAQYISVPIQNEGSFSADNLFTSDNSAVVSSPVVASPLSAESVFTTGSSSASSPLFSFSGPAVSDNSFSDMLSGGATSGSSFVEATNGPDGSPLSVIQAPAVTLPAVEGPVVTLASQPIPAPRVISQRCICTKTVVKPQIFQRQVTVPRLQRYLKRTVTPVVENIAYKSTPITQGTSTGTSSVFSGSAAVGAPAPVVFSSEAGSVATPSRFGSSPVVVSAGPSCPRFY